jgi:hypothetical protein
MRHCILEHDRGEEVTHETDALRCAALLEAAVYWCDQVQSTGFQIVAFTLLGKSIYFLSLWKFAAQRTATRHGEIHKVQ